MWILCNNLRADSLSDWTHLFNRNLKVRFMNRSILGAIFAVAVTATGFAQAGSSLSAVVPLTAGQTLESGNGKYMLVMQASDGNLVVYRKSDMKVIWTTGKPAGAGAWAVVQTDKNFVVYSGPYPAYGTVAWSSGTGQAGLDDHSVNLSIWPDGKLTLMTSTSQGVPYWSTPGDSTVCPDGNAKTAYPICMRPGTKYQSNSYVYACTYAQAQVLANQFVNDGAVMGACH
jgi:hypothetical protein